MNSKFFVFALAAMATLAGCSKNEVSNNVIATKTVQIEARNGETKTTLEGGRYVRWSENDQVKAFANIYDPYVSTSTTITNGGANATFTFEIPAEDEVSLLAYPASGALEVDNDDYIHVNIPAVQAAVAGSFGQKANVAIGKMVSETEASFQNVGALLSVDIKNDNITSVLIKFPSASYAVTGLGLACFDGDAVDVTGDDIAAEGAFNYVQIKADAGTTLTKDEKYYAVVYPATYTGIELIFTRADGKVAKYTNSATLEVDSNDNKNIFATSIQDSKWMAQTETYSLITSDDDLEEGKYIIGMALNSDLSNVQYLENTKKTKPSGIAFGTGVTLSEDKKTITLTTATDATWDFVYVDGETVATSGYAIESTVTTEKGEKHALGTTTSNDGLTSQAAYVGKPWTITKNNTYNWSFKFNETSRYLCVYSLVNPRTYTSSSTNANGVFFLYKLDDPRKTLATPTNLATEGMVLSWDAVEHAGSYEVTVGSADAVTVATNSYTFEGVADYYSVSVVAVPENTMEYKTSKPATATDLKFGTPTLVTPTLAEGTVTETSLSVTWTVDKRATAGYDCDIYDGETKLDKSTNVSTGSVSFSGLADGKTYTVKVQAKAVTGTKAYVASEVASISVATKAAVHIGDITTTGTYTVMNAVVMAVVNTSSFIAGDETGSILVYKGSHGCAVGNIVDIAGSVVTYEGVLEFSTPTISNKRTGSAPVYPTPVEANSDFVNGYSSNAITAYVHGVGTLDNSAKTITIGTKVISLVAVPTPAVADGEVEFTGYVYGVKNGNIKACTLTCQTYVDPTAPTLSINPDPATKTWASDATDKYTVNVTTTNGGWTISPATLTWATVVENHTANTIEITPNGANTTAADYTATITVKHAVNPSLTKTITLTQLKAGAAPKVYTYTFNSKSWGAKVSIDGGTETAANWTGTADGNQFNSSNSPLGVQVTTGAGSGATVTSPISFTNVTKVEVVYASSAKGVGTIAISVGGVAAGSAQSISKSQTETTLTFTPGSTKNGTVVLTPTVTTNSMGIRKVIVYAD